MRSRLLVIASVGGVLVSAASAQAQEAPGGAASPAMAPVFGPAPDVTPAAQPASMPLPPAGSSPGQVLPPVGADGRYVTPNRDLTREETVWHMRVALNVAALGCPNGDRVVASYNAMLAAKKPELAAASFGLDRTYRARFAGAWQARTDDAMTRLYNFFAQPPAQKAFCTTAELVLSEAQTVAPSAFADFAEGALPRLEAPFTEFYAGYARYLADLAAWQARAVPQVVFAAADAPANGTPALVAVAAPVQAVSMAAGAAHAMTAVFTPAAAPATMLRVAAESQPSTRRMIGPD